MQSIQNPPAMNSGLAFQLFETLNQYEIVYCHWKSNELLEAGMNGETDLDLLVDRNSFNSTIAILLNLGFKQGVVRWGPGTPGVLHFYAFDPLAAHLIHVHLYNQLLTGESLVKTHVLPCGSMLLGGCEKIGNVKVPTKDAEAALCVLRTFIKHGSLLHTILHGSGRTVDEPDEFWFADDGITASAAYDALQGYYQAVDEQLFTECFQAAVEGKSFLKNWLLGRRIRRCLRGCARHTNVERWFAYASLVFTKLRRIVRGKIKNKVLESGGVVIAFIGGDATGKSTLVAKTAKWLGENFAIRVVHVGKPTSTWLTSPLHFLLPVARRLFPNQRHQAQQAAKTSKSTKESKQPTHGSVSLFYAIRAVTLAWDRSRLLRQVRRRAAAGEIVICDRYPAEKAGATDGPRMNLQSDCSASWIVKTLANYEQRLYAQAAPPDIAIRLQVPIEIAIWRNQQRDKRAKHSNRDLEIRHQQVRDWNKTGTLVVRDIDTSASLEQTFLLVKQTIWESL